MMVTYHLLFVVVLFFFVFFLLFFFFFFFFFFFVFKLFLLQGIFHIYFTGHQFRSTNIGGCFVIHSQVAYCRFYISFIHVIYRPQVMICFL